ncbi:unannotated protein [freshwater metagenome]|uniref:Unannotated protein n=1 Tax=freshwater metagenome TaxID=449393 RepID=A0A6J6EMQ5_9ZZZZ
MLNMSYALGSAVVVMVSAAAPGPVMLTAWVLMVPLVSVMFEMDESKVMVSPLTASAAASRNLQLPGVLSLQLPATATPSAFESTVMVEAALADPANAVSSAAALPATRTPAPPRALPVRARDRRSARFNAGVVASVVVMGPCSKSVTSWYNRIGTVNHGCGRERTQKARSSGRAFLLFRFECDGVASSASE